MDYYSQREIFRLVVDSFGSSDRFVGEVVSDPASARYVDANLVGKPYAKGGVDTKQILAVKSASFPCLIQGMQENCLHQRRMCNHVEDKTHKKEP